MGEVAAVGEREAQDLVAGVGDRGEHRGVGLGAGVRLHVGVFGAEELLGAVDRELLGDVDVLAAAVVAAAGVALGVLVGQHRALGLQHGARGEVLAGDHFEGAALAAELRREDGGDLGVDSERGALKTDSAKTGLLMTGTGPNEGCCLVRLAPRGISYRPRRSGRVPWPVAPRWESISTPVATHASIATDALLRRISCAPRRPRRWIRAVGAAPDRVRMSLAPVS